MEHHQNNAPVLVHHWHDNQALEYHSWPLRLRTTATLRGSWDPFGRCDLA